MKSRLIAAVVLAIALIVAMAGTTSALPGSGLCRPPRCATPNPTTTIRPTPTIVGASTVPGPVPSVSLIPLPDTTTYR